MLSSTGALCALIGLTASLFCLPGEGRLRKELHINQEEGKQAVEILPGTVIHIPANVKHWHGAASDGWFAQDVYKRQRVHCVH